MGEEIPCIDPRRIRDMCKRYGFSRDARELRGFIIERVEEILGEGFDLMAQSPRAKNDPLNSSLSLKVMKKSHDPNSEIFAYARIPSFNGHPIYYQFGFFRTVEEIKRDTTFAYLEFGEFKRTWEVLDDVRAEHAYYDMLNQLNG